MIRINGLILPEPYPGEYFNSMILRLGWDLGYSNSTFLKVIFGIDKFINFSRHLPGAAIGDWNELYRHSTLPYLLATYTINEREEMVSDILSSERYLIRCTNSPKSRKSLWYCPECWKEQMEEYGTFYFLTEHQIPGLDVCLKHHCLLRESGTNNIEDLRSLAPGETVPAEPADWLPWENYEDFAGLSREQLDFAIFKGVKEKGLFKNNWQVDPKLLEDLLRKRTGMAKSIQSITGIVDHILKRVNQIPLHVYAALVYALDVDLKTAGKIRPENCPVPRYLVNSPKKKDAPEHVDCINVFCGGTARKIGAGKSVFYRCPECNIVFSSSGKIIQTGRLFEESIKKLRETESLEKISATVGKSSGYIKRVLNGETSVDYVDKRIEQILRSFKESAEYRMDFNPIHKDAVFLKKYNPELYKTLYFNGLKDGGNIYTRACFKFLKVTKKRPLPREILAMTIGLGNWLRLLPKSSETDTQKENYSEIKDHV